MPSLEERNVAALSIWHNEMAANRQFDLGPGLLAPSGYNQHTHEGVRTFTPANFGELLAPRLSRRPRFRYDTLEIVARGDRVAGLWRTEELNDERSPLSQLGIYRLEDGKIAESWYTSRHSDADPWPNAPRPREQWSIASSEALTPDEEANLATFNLWNDIRYNRSNDFEAIAELITNPLVIHGTSGTQTIPAAEVVRNAAAFAERYPGFTASSDDLFVVGDRAAKRFCYRYSEPSPERGSLQCGVAIYRFENHRLAEYWQVNLPLDVDWG
jgi:hypothetical protein